jgi:hypothetical protein
MKEILTESANSNILLLWEDLRTLNDAVTRLYIFRNLDSSYGEVIFSLLTLFPSNSTGKKDKKIDVLQIITPNKQRYLPTIVSTLLPLHFRIQALWTKTVHPAPVQLRYIKYSSIYHKNRVRR